MNFIFHLMFKSIKSDVSYRLDFFATLLVLGLFFLTRLLFINALVSIGGSSLGGWSEEDMGFLVFTLIWILLLTDTFDSSVLTYFKKLYLGEADAFFLKPQPLTSFIFFGWIKSSNLIVLPVLFGLGMWKYQSLWMSKGAMALLAYLGASLLAVVINLVFIASLSSLTFVFRRFIPADFIFSEMTKVMILPTSIFPRKVAQTLLVLIPSVFTSAVPSALLLKQDYKPLGVLLLGAFLNLAIFYGLFSFMRKRYDGLGG